MSKNLPRLMPTGTCWCGCGAETAIGSFFARGHDKTAEAAYLAIHHNGQVAQMLHAHGYGPDPEHSVTKTAVDKGLWLECPHGCGYRGARESINNHVNRHHREK